MFKKATALLLSCVLLLACAILPSCSASDVVMRYKSKTITEADYAYVMAFIKGYYAYMVQMYYGSSYSIDSFLNTEIGDGVTYADQLTEAVNESCRMILITEQLCAENGLKVQDEEVLNSIKDVIAQLEEDEGGKDALEITLAKKGFSIDQIERYELYNALLSVLKEFRYGESGAARIPEEDVRKAFADGYVKAEAYLFPFYLSDDSGNRIQNVLDLASTCSEETVRTAFLKTFVKVEYLSYDEEAEANEALAQLNAGADPADLYASSQTHIEPVCVHQDEAEQAMYEGVPADGSWHLVAEEDGAYVVRKSGVGEADLAGNEQTVRASIQSEEAAAYFLSDFVTVEHILYDDEEQARSVYEDILAGKTTFAEHTGETKDSGTTYTFTHGVMVAPFETASFALDIDGYTLVQTDYGWHLIHRLPLDTDQYSEDTALAGLSRAILEDEAEELFESMKKTGDAYVFADPGENAHYSYSEPSLLELGNLNETMATALKNAADGELLSLTIPSSGVYLFRKIAAEDADLQSVYSSVADPLISDAFYDYLSTFYDQVTVDTEALAKFDIRTSESYYY